MSGMGELVYHRIAKGRNSYRIVSLFFLFFIQLLFSMYICVYVMLHVAYGFVDFEDRRDAQVFFSHLLFYVLVVFVALILKRSVIL